MKCLHNNYNDNTLENNLKISLLKTQNRKHSALYK